MHYHNWTRIQYRYLQAWGMHGPKNIRSYIIGPRPATTGPWTYKSPPRICATATGTSHWTRKGRERFVDPEQHQLQTVSINFKQRWAAWIFQFYCLTLCCSCSSCLGETLHKEHQLNNFLDNMRGFWITPCSSVASNRMVFLRHEVIHWYSLPFANFGMVSRDWHEQTHRERTSLVNEMTNVLDDRDWCDGSLRRGSAINKSFDLRMSLRMALFEDLIQTHLSLGKHGILVGHALSDASQIRAWRPGVGWWIEYVWVCTCICVGPVWDLLGPILHSDASASSSCCWGQSQQGLSGQGMLDVQALQGFWPVTSHCLGISKLRTVSKLERH